MLRICRVPNKVTELCYPFQSDFMKQSNMWPVFQKVVHLTFNSSWKRIMIYLQPNTYNFPVQKTVKNLLIPLSLAQTSRILHRLTSDGSMNFVYSFHNYCVSWHCQNMVLVTTEEFVHGFFGAKSKISTPSIRILSLELIKTLLISIKSSIVHKKVSLTELALLDFGVPFLWTTKSAFMLLSTLHGFPLVIVFMKAPNLSSEDYRSWVILHSPLDDFSLKIAPLVCRYPVSHRWNQINVICPSSASSEGSVHRP